MSTRTYDHNGHTNLPIACPDWDDVEVAGRVRMLMRNDLEHELICTVARDRILCLAKEKEQLRQLLLAAKHLILASRGPGNSVIETAIGPYVTMEDPEWINAKDKLMTFINDL